MLETTPTTPLPPGVSRFEQEARAVLTQLRAALLGVLAELPGNGRRAVDLQRTLKVDRMTGWRLHRIASASDPLGAGVHVPAATTMQRVLGAAASLGAAAGTTERARQSYLAFEALVERYAGDRSTFDSMVSGFATDEPNQVDLTHRRATFRGQSHMLGVRTRVEMVTSILHPNRSDPTLVDSVVLHGYYDLHRLRAGAALATAGVYLNVEGPGGGRFEAISGEGSNDLGFIPEFSDVPPAPMEVTQLSDRLHMIEILGDEVGVSTASTSVFGHIMRACGPCHRTRTETKYGLTSALRAPSELFVANVLLHAGTFGRLPASSLFLSEMTGSQLGNLDAPRRDRYVLPVSDQVTYAGQGIGGLLAQEMPRYGELLAWAMQRLGWDADAFHAYHLRADYPPVPSRAVIEFPLPEAPGAGG